ncbi:PREDICTED: uncharacterized protein LOC105570738 [Vollenhovia emeryi]|uniref:uncharacterized protein LOC105570738 n=1 Tax=Vollenhovia emeryi TaxID=411798 RepID=UPI0005F3DD6F|nr:PREDICTED: uncharacterized protein LOC105570738 [Vollenhovia emeryi]
MPQDGGVQITAESLVHKVAVRVPPFWNDEPELWFAQLEGQFTISEITQDSTKYSYALSQLNSSQIKEIKDVITQPPAADKYKAVKQALIQRMSVSQEQRTRQLLELEELGDRKPSQFLRHLRTLAGNNVPDSLLRTLWLERLPQQAQMILATRTDDRLNDVAEQADRIHEMTNKAVVASTYTPSATSLEAKVEALIKQVASLTTHLSRDKKRDKKSERKRSRSRSQKSAKGANNEKHCYYHNRFGEKAQKCTQPCTYKSENEKGSH